MQRVFLAATFGALALAALAGAAEPGAGAATPQEVGGGKGWTAYAFTEKSGKVCYLVGHPLKVEPASANRGRIDAMVTERPRENQLNVVNFDVGFPFKEGSDASLDVDGHSFSLFTAKEAAWARDAATDKAVTEALARGKHAVLKGTSSRGTVVTQTYSLEGFSDALAAADKACNIRR